MSKENRDPLPVSREEAQRRADRIAGFGEELRALEREGALALTDDQRARIAAHHEALLDQLTGMFDVDRSLEQKRLSLGMRIVSPLGAFALAAAVYYFFYRFWGGMDPSLQVLVLAAGPVAALFGMEIAARRERTLYVTGLSGILAVSFFVINLIALAALSNVPLSPAALLAWGVFAGIIAYAYGLRVPLLGALAFLVGFIATIGSPTDVCVWDAFGHRPENSLPFGLVLFGVPFILRHGALPSFPPVYRAVGLVCLFTPFLILSSMGYASYLRFSPARIEAVYQIAGFALACLGIWFGVRRGLSETTNLASGFFMILLYIKFIQWWWDWMPKWIFFLILGAVAIGLLLVMRKLHAMTTRRREA